MAELVMDRRIVWNPRRLKEIDEAKVVIMDYKRQGYVITKADGVTPMDRFLPSLAEVIIKAQKITQKIMKILCATGDERVVWDKNDGPEALQAKERFKDLLKQGYKAYSVDSKGKKNRPIEEFDVDAEEILMIPKTVKG
jgi:hypothetical protein